MRTAIQVLLLLVICSLLHSCQYGKAESDDTWVFVSMPDFLNVDCDYPQKGWEESLSYILESVKKENPEFIVVPGDLVMGHWDSPGWNSADSIAKYAKRYYSAWKHRMDDHGLKYYTSIGDHELGDNPWRKPEKMEALKHYRKAFADHLSMPANGPEHLKGTAFWWRHKNVLFISVDVFEARKDGKNGIKPGVTGKQLAWMKAVFEANKDVTHKIVMGHTPVLGPVRKWASSGLTIKEGRESEFWKTMRDYNVDAYLCGEVHAITCKERDGIMQVAHGGLIGYTTRTNYMVVTVSEDKIEMEIKEIEMKPYGDFLWQTGHNRPLEFVDITDANRTRGFYTVGTVTVNKIKEKKFLNRKGYFLREYESGVERAVSVFRKDNKRGLPTALPKIIVE